MATSRTTKYALVPLAAVGVEYYRNPSAAYSVVTRPRLVALADTTVSAVQRVSASGLDYLTGTSTVRTGDTAVPSQDFKMRYEPLIYSSFAAAAAAALGMGMGKVLPLFVAINGVAYFMGWWNDTSEVTTRGIGGIRDDINRGLDRLTKGAGKFFDGFGLDSTLSSIGSSVAGAIGGLGIDTKGFESTFKDIFYVVALVGGAYVVYLFLR